MSKCNMVFYKDDALMPSDWAYCCSNCKRRISHRPIHDMAFCPYCGSAVNEWKNEDETEDEL